MGNIILLNMLKVAAQGSNHNAELQEQICDTLVAGGYFRARLNIDMFDKLLGGMCWTITGSNHDIDLEFEDDFTLGQKVRLAEEVVGALKSMGYREPVFPHQIQGLDYAGLLPVVKWLIKKLMDSRDTRSVLNRKQGLLNFRLRQTDKNSQSEGVFAANDSTLRGDTSYLKSVIFNGKPKRAFKANQRSKISFQDPKRVHIALREFNDMSANDAFKKMLSNIQANREEEEQNRELNRRKQTLAMKKAGGALGGALAKGLGSKLAGLTK